MLLLAAAPPLRAAAAEPGTALSPANDDCLACHGDPSTTRADGSRVAVDAAQFQKSVHGQAPVACIDCHADLTSVTEFPHAETLARVSCASCHDEAVTAYSKGVHAQARQQANGSAATCVDCHGTHGMAASKDPASPTYALNLPTLCGRCHGNPEIIRRGHIQIGNIVAQYQDSIHGRAVSKSGLLVAPNCSSCHGNHEIRRRTDPASPVHAARVPDTCGKCHEGIETLYRRGAHGTALASEDPQAPVCKDCHTAHNIQSAGTPTWRLAVIRECGTCHVESMKTYRDTFHGQVTALGFTRVAACADCHGAHEIHPKHDARSTVSSVRLVETCGKCHPGANENFVRYDPHADKHNRARNPGLFHAARLMDGLLILVFAFFGIHSGLWFTRTVRVRWSGRGEAGQGGKSDGDGAS
ncbi:MAG: cytochrome c3 family protein [Acidobacteria bacterium]|nr:cytochrome c3 family protein [Acidobacteriota bacterium]